MIRKTSLLAGVALALSLAACSPDPESSFARGQEAFAEHDFRAARVALIAGLREKPGNLEMRALLARTQIALGDGEGAAATLERLPAGKKGAPEFATLMGEAEVLRGRYAEAAAVVEGIETAGADRVRALALLAEGKVEDAAKAFAVGEGRYPADPRLLASSARFELARGDVERARMLSDRAAEVDAASIEARLAQALVARVRDRLPASLAYYDAALKEHPANFEARLGKADLLVVMEKYDDARPLVSGLFEEAPENRDIALLRAKLAARDGEWKQVRDILQAYEADMRDIPQMRLVYGEALLELGNGAQALTLLQPMLRANPSARDLRALIARTQLAVGDAQGALDTIELLAMRPDAQPEELAVAAKAAKAAGSGKAAEFEKRSREATPEWVGGELAKADRALRNRQWESAERSYEAIMAKGASKNALVLNNLAYAKSQLGKKDEALKMALQAVELDPQNASILDTAGWLLVQNGSRDRGVAMLEKAAKLDPDNAAIANRLARAKKS